VGTIQPKYVIIGKPGRLPWLKYYSDNGAAAHRDFDVSAANLSAALRQNLEKLLEQPIEQLLSKRYKRFRALGNFSEGKAAAAASRF